MNNEQHKRPDDSVSAQGIANAILIGAAIWLLTMIIVLLRHYRQQ